MKARTPIKLGTVNAVEQDNPKFKDVFDPLVLEEKQGRKIPWMYLALGVVAMVAVAVAIVVVVGGSEDNNNKSLGNGEATLNPTRNPTLPTLNPTTSLPTTSPETSSPTTPEPTTLTPTESPTPPPTDSPLDVCTGDSKCGCNRIFSPKIDLLWFMDESRSVGESNYNKTRLAIQNFTRSRPYGENGVRHGMIEFNHRVELLSNGIIDFDEYANRSEFLENVMTKFDEDLSIWGTRHDLALQYSLNNFLNLERNKARNDSQLVMIMITDGNPCCPKEVDGTWNPDLDPKDDLKLISESNFLQAYTNFTFIFLPVEKVNGVAGIRTDLFTGTEMATGTLIELETTKFDQLIPILSNEALIPQGPCIPQPSSNRRRLLTTKPGEELGTTVAGLRVIP